MNSFSNRLGFWLAATQDQRRSLLAGGVALLFFTHFMSWRGFIIVAGLAAMLEGWAMLMSADKES